VTSAKRDRRRVTDTGKSRRDFHTSSGLDVGTRESPQGHHRHLSSGGRRGKDPESPSERVYKREADKVKGAADKHYEPGRGEQEKLRYCRKQNWSKELEDDKMFLARAKGRAKGRIGIRWGENAREGI